MQARRSIAGMTRASDPIRCETTLLTPATPVSARWAFAVLPGAASGRLPSRGLVAVDGTLAGAPFRTTLQPDGAGSHWFKVSPALMRAADVTAGDTVTLVLTPLAETPEPAVPVDIRQALAAHAAAQAQWKTLTPAQRRDWIHWITSGKQAATRVKRLATACDMLASGKRRACCFDRSGRYRRGGMGPPEAAPSPEPAHGA